MLATLQRARGGWVSRAELFNDAGCHYLSNNASSELRPKGYEVEHKIVRGLHSYRLVSSGGSGAVALGTVPHQPPPEISDASVPSLPPRGYEAPHARQSGPHPAAGHPLTLFDEAAA